MPRPHRRTNVTIGHRNYAPAPCPCRPKGGSGRTLRVAGVFRIRAATMKAGGIPSSRSGAGPGAPLSVGPREDVPQAGHAAPAGNLLRAGHRGWYPGDDPHPGSPRDPLHAPPVEARAPAARTRVGPSGLLGGVPDCRGPRDLLVCAEASDAQRLVRRVPGGVGRTGAGCRGTKRAQRAATGAAGAAANQGPHGRAVSSKYTK